MDLDKLSLRPSEIDKNTGRIVLPKSQEELDRLSGRVPGMNVNTRVKAYMPSAQRPTFPQPGVISQQLATPAAPTSQSAFWQHPFYGILGFCSLIAAVPVVFFCATLIRENGDYKKQLGDLETRNAVLMARQPSSSDVSQVYSLTALNQEMARMRNDMAQLSTSGFEVYVDEEEAPPVEEVVYVEDFADEGAPSEETAPEAPLTQ